MGPGTMRITSKDVQAARFGKDPWALGNSTLEDLCRNHPRHVETEDIVAKVWLIGRAYSASIERGSAKARGADVSNDWFYTRSVPAAIRKSGIDRWLAGLNGLTGEEPRAHVATLKVHGLFVRALRRLTGLEKRSLASKYLHFHRPDLFFIHDSRAASTVRKLEMTHEPIDAPAVADPEYVRFVGAALDVRRDVRTRYGVTLTPREVDRLLLRIEARTK